MSLTWYRFLKAFNAGNHNIYAIAKATKVSVNHVKKYESILEKLIALNVQKSVNEGFTSIDDIARETNISKNIIEKHLHKGETDTERAYNIFHTINEGTLQIADIAKKNNYTLHSVRKIVTGKQITAYKAQLVDEALAIGATTSKEIFQLTGVSTYFTTKYLRKKGLLQKNDYGMIPRNKELDELIFEGLTLEAIGQKVSLTRERVRQYINQTDQLPAYKQHRKSHKQLKKELALNEESTMTDLAQVILNATLSRADEATTLAINYYCTRQNNPRNISLNSLQQFYDSYVTARNKGEKVSLQKLANNANLSLSATQRLLNVAGLKPMFKEGNKWNQRINLSKGQKDAVVRSLNLGLSQKDVAYFLGIKPHTVHTHASLNMIPATITYNSIISQVYEATDLGFSTAETAELLGITQSSVNGFLVHRPVHEPYLIELLQQMYNDTRITTPYVRDKVKQLLSIK